jgi:ATP-dependent Clp protease ATP-binding subunit ClpA
MLLIVDLQMEQIRERLAEYGLNVQLSDEARTWLAEEGYDPAFGARPLRRALQKFVESPLSVKILQGEFEEGDTVVVDHDDKTGIVFQRFDKGTSIEIKDQVSA